MLESGETELTDLVHDVVEGIVEDVEEEHEAMEEHQATHQDTDDMPCCCGLLQMMCNMHCGCGDDSHQHDDGEDNTTPDDGEGGEGDNTIPDDDPANSLPAWF